MLAGLIFDALGIVLLYRTWWKISFDLSSNRNAAVDVSLVIVSAVMIWAGGALIFAHFGLL